MFRCVSLLALFGVFVLGGCASTATYVPPATAKTAPALQIPNQYGQLVDLKAATAEGWSVVFFYPKANTPG